MLYGWFYSSTVKFWKEETVEHLKNEKCLFLIAFSFYRFSNFFFIFLFFMLSWDNWDLGSTLRHFVNIAIILINVCPDYCGYVFRKMFLENFTMNCSFTDPGAIASSFPEELQDREGGGRPYLKCLPLLHQHFSFLIVFNNTFNRYSQILLTLNKTFIAPLEKSVSVSYGAVFIILKHCC